jgi:hypothetical protein
MRCSRGRNGCGRRFTLKRSPDTYVRSPKCPYCKSFNVYSVEMERRIEQARQDTCRCASLPFPHRKGAILGCAHHPKPDEEWTEDDYRDYEACLATPRSEWV